ncbi:MAG: SDR family NAD(P)-dependent oxidoreductase [Nonomuraea sp.]|nr:SDR family NAD(P)-dependent oxidoreductase [Nonomuraea sp.]
MKVAVVTGGASGIGRAVARELRRRGVAVTIADVDEPAGKQVAADFGLAFARLGAGRLARGQAVAVGRRTGRGPRGQTDRRALSTRVALT